MCIMSAHSFSIGDVYLPFMMSLVALYIIIAITPCYHNVVYIAVQEILFIIIHQIHSIKTYIA